MKWEDQDIDKLFQNASENPAPVFKEEYWTQFEKSLPVKKSKRKVGFYWWVIATSAVAVMIVGLWNLRGDREQLSSTKETEKLQFSESKSVIKNNNTSFSSTKKQVLENDLKGKMLQNPRLSAALNEKLDAQNVGTKATSVVSDFNSILVERESDPLPVTENSTVQQAILQETSNDDFSDIQLELKSLNNNYQELALSGILPAIKLKRTQFYFDLGVDLGQSAIKNFTNASNFYTGFSLGIGVMKSNKQKWNWSAGVNVAAHNYANLEINKRTKVYGFGVQNFERKINYKQLFQLEIPLFVGKCIQKHNFQVGLVPSFLIATRLNYAITQDQFTEHHNSVYGFRDGLKIFSLKPSLRYSYQILPKWQLGMSLQIQALSTINTNIFIGELSKHPLNGQIFIRRTIFK